MAEIHQTDVKALLKENYDVVQEKRMIFEKFKVMTDLITSIQSSPDENIRESSSEDEDNFIDLESTDMVDIESFNKMAKAKAMKDLSSLKSLMDMCHPDKLRSDISSLNQQQRKLFDDFSERIVSTDVNEQPFYLFLTGNAGTGKSFLLNVMIEAVKHRIVAPGDDLKKPSLLVMAPTANAAGIVGGKTIDSVLAFNPTNRNSYSKAEASRQAMMKFQYENVKVAFCDEVSMLGSSKLAKINFRFQDIVDGDRKNLFMGGISFVASGKIMLSNSL